MRGHGTAWFYKTFKIISSRFLILNDDVMWRRTDKSFHLGSAIFDFMTYKTLRICQNFLSVHIFFCQRTSFYTFQNFNTSLTYREFNLGRHACSTLKKMCILQVGITASFKFASLWNFGHPHIVVFSPQSLLKLPDSLRCELVIRFQCLRKGKLVNQHKKPRSSQHRLSLGTRLRGSPMKGWFTSHLVSPSFCCWSYVSLLSGATDSLITSESKGCTLLLLY